MQASGVVVQRALQGAARDGTDTEPATAPHTHSHTHPGGYATVLVLGAEGATLTALTQERSVHLYKSLGYHLVLSTLPLAVRSAFTGARTSHCALVLK